MKPGEFRYERPASLADALALMGQDEVAALAGGQSLMPMMNFRVAQPEVLVDLGGIAELSGIERADGAMRIGAMTRYVDIMAHHGLPAQLPLVAMALPHVAHSAIRNRGTLGGSLALADPAAEMPAVARVLGASLHLAGASGVRSVAADDFFLGAYETALEPGELLTAIEFPVAQDGDRYGFHEVARRHGDYAMAGVAVAVRGGQPAIAFFSVADGAVRAPAAEAALAADPQDIDAAVEALGEIQFAGDLNAGEAMKRHLAGVVLRRAWEGLA
jgi:carbon-monoxide dehydrogenase medium subunit